MTAALTRRTRMPTTSRTRAVPAVADSLRSSDWMAQAACRGVDPELFHPVSTNPEQTAPAKAVCATCPVRWRCLDWAVRTQEFGIAGGLDENERRKLRRHLRADTAVAS